MSNSCKEDYSELFERKILPVSWVDYGSYFNYLKALDKTIGQGDLNLIKEIASITSEKNFKGLYKLFMSLLSPKAILKKIPNIWKIQHDQGTCSLIWHSDKIVDLVVTDWEPPKDHELM
jgi:hypothetical protein